MVNSIEKYKKIANYYINLYITGKEEQIKHYVAQENALQKLFKDIYPKNNNLDEVLIKVAALNHFYSTRIMSVYDVANRIVDLVQNKEIDIDTSKWNESVVENIKCVKINDKEMKFYSFATKYCCQYNYDVFPIYDGMVERTLKELNSAGIVKDFSTSDLKNYSELKKIIDNLRKDLGFEKEQYSYKDFDHFLWLYGRDLKVIDTIKLKLKTIDIKEEISVEDLHNIGNEFRKKNSAELLNVLKDVSSDNLTLEIVEKMFKKEKKNEKR